MKPHQKVEQAMEWDLPGGWVESTE